jgi:maltokinase
MGDPVESPVDLERLVDLELLPEWLERQRWYASKSRSVHGVEIAESLVLREDPALVLSLVQARFATGTHELYQLLLAPGTFDALTEPAEAAELIARFERRETIETEQGRFAFERADGSLDVRDGDPARPIGAEQSNTSIVYDDRLVLKVFRKLEPGINPELEMLRFLTERGFGNIAPLQGWYEYEGQALSTTLGVAQTFVPGAVDGWDLALGEILTRPDVFLDRLGGLGTVTAEMHNVLASDSGDPAFSPEEPSQESLSLLTATVDEDIERVFLRLPDDERVAEIAGRAQDVRAKLAARAQAGVGGREIRTHGDYHLGQTLSAGDAWVIIDFEGEPARPLHERREKRSALRDVASMLRSFAYAASAVEILRGARAPEDFEARASERFLEAYFERIDATLLPAGEAQIRSLLSLFELEKAIYELQYELDNRPEWVPIPVAGIRRLLDEE